MIGQSGTGPFFGPRALRRPKDGTIPLAAATFHTTGNSVLLSEPQRSQGDLHFSLLGIPVRIHPMFWLVGALFGMQLHELHRVLLWILALFVSILVHEFGHALVMRAFGFRPAIVLYGMGGLTIRDAGGWGGAPRLAAWRQVLISIAGPGAGFLLAAGMAAAILSTRYGEDLFFVGWMRRPVWFNVEHLWLTDFVNHVFYICLLWGLVNLLPIYPLDGGKIAREVFTALLPGPGYVMSLQLSIVAAAGMAVWGGWQWHDWFVVLLFGALAYEGIMQLQAGSARRPW
jgi:stage IV sporulation protein FB